jgi:hypothetical protein
MPLADRFWLKVDFDGPVPEHRPELGPCWSWIASTNSKGYGQIMVGSRVDGTRKLVRAHRLAYELLVGHIPTDAEAGYRVTLDHLCRNHGCVNPAHLEVVSHRENVLRGVGLSATNAVKTHCPQGHAYDARNTYRSRGNSRLCRACHREYEQRRRDLRKAQR